MKITISIKDPDGFYESIKDHAVAKLRENGHEDLYHVLLKISLRRKNSSNWLMKSIKRLSLL